MANGRSSGPRQAKVWNSMPSVSLALTADGTSLGGSLAFSAPETVLRCLGELTIGPTFNSAPVAGDSAKIGFGICVVSTDAFTAGAVPDPLGEPEFPWLYWRSHDLSMVLGAATDNDGSTFVRHAFDVKSQRKIKPRESLVTVVQYSDSVGTPPIAFEMPPWRFLFLD